MGEGEIIYTALRSEEERWEEMLLMYFGPQITCLQMCLVSAPRAQMYPTFQSCWTAMQPFGEGINVPNP